VVEAPRRERGLRRDEGQCVVAGRGRAPVQVLDGRGQVQIRVLLLNNKVFRIYAPTTDMPLTTATDVARPPERRLRRTWARWMHRRIARVLTPRAPACAPCEPRGRVWRAPPRSSRGPHHRDAMGGAAPLPSTRTMVLCTGTRGSRVRCAPRQRRLGKPGQHPAHDQGARRSLPRTVVNMHELTTGQLEIHG
jgi:hypothetical protein